ncbi:MAG: hypothetical protein ACI8QZ_003829 [Chlamydiales bacterium]|jgi:hypothetical protein
MSDKTRGLTDPFGSTSEDTDATQQTFNFGEGGVPWLLLLGYLSFLVFFAWYALGFQLPAFVGPDAEQVQEAPAAE